ncbi:hypothetical protein SmJEL517_g01515 [Synchytrium microbalum]|uniref:PDZ domain-containing protein n=1 Tax=Synchytrium microbalum TaxID=1806994 RepID=A0A507CAG8_9FUNG|nr:uncharacterized protein SmJEL517_g01515 [Synchytrium microbalum]TPX36338.1 hypothetical protein SmJEL517_g01515 [Synchytrium microbalum]
MEEVEEAQDALQDQNGIETSALADLMPGTPWESTLKSTISSLISIRNIAVRTFDTEKQRASQASGFIVDKTRGIILTNRHVVQPGPTLAEGILTESKEEVQLKAIYRDPVHDFGFFSFDISKVNYMNLHEIPLCPSKARVGVDLRVVGNDAGERLSILSGIMARLDREAPAYGTGRYNDFNTFYFQAASMTSGGSSGSPVIDIEGECLALNAGGNRKSASSFFLPLDRIVRALDLIKAGKPVARGTIQTIFRFKTFDELKRLSLDKTVEHDIRKHFGTQATGMLQVGQVLPKGPADGILETGDIIYKINGHFVNSFIPVEEVFDDNVGGIALFHVQRAKTLLEVNVVIQDLHIITPDRFVEVSGGIVHALSYQMASGYMVPVQGVVVSGAGYMFALAGIARGSIIVSINNQLTPDLDSFIQVFQELHDGQRAPLRYYSVGDINKPRVALIRVDRRYHSFRLAIRDDQSGFWNYTNMPPCQGVYQMQPHKAAQLQLDASIGIGRNVVSALCQVVFNSPFHIDGVMGMIHSSVGVVLDHELGLIVVDRHCIPTTLGDTLITFANSIIVNAQILYVHQVHNFAVLRYDTRLLGETVIVSAQISSKKLKQGSSAIMVGLTKYFTPIVRSTKVTTIHPFILPDSHSPAFRAVNSEVFEFENPIHHGGVIVDVDDGKVQAFWSAFSKQDKTGSGAVLMGMEPKPVVEIVDRIRESLKNPAGEDQIITKGLEIEMAYTQIAQARHLGLSDEWVQKIEACHQSRRNVIIIRRMTSGTESSKLLQESDLILAADGETVTKFEDIESAKGPDSIELTILRDGKEITGVHVPFGIYAIRGTERIVSFCGAIFQMPHLAVYQQLKEVPKGVLCSVVYQGTPAQMYKLQPMTFIQEVESIPTDTLDEFLDVIKKIKADTFARFKTISFSRFVKVIGVRVDAHYFGITEITANPEFKKTGTGNEWELISYPSPT